MKTIIALVDFSDVTHRVTEQAAALAHAFSGRLILLHAVPEQPVVIELGIASPTVLRAASEGQVEADYNRLLTLRDALTSHGTEVLVQQLDQGNAARVIEQCRSLEADFIVVGAHHHSALYHLFVGTFTSDVVKRSSCPVLVVPAAEEKPAPVVEDTALASSATR
jgi:nucleotide-binding universal stress UspA family protein